MSTTAAPVPAALGALADLGLYQSMSLSYSTYEFQLPWLQVGIAAALIAAVIAVSVAYALRRCRASSVVGALRDDAV